MASPAGISLIILAVAVAVGIGFLVPVLLELRRSVERLTSILRITEENLNPTLVELRATLRNVDRITNDLGTVTDDLRGVSGSIRRVGKNAAVLSGLVSVLGLGVGTKVAGWEAGIGTGLTYLARHLFKGKGVRE